MHNDLHEDGERVHDRSADAVEAAGDFVAFAAELAARVERRHDGLERRDLRLFMRVYGNAAAVVDDAHTIIG